MSVSRKTKFVIAYLALLGLSHLWQAARVNDVATEEVEVDGEENLVLVFSRAGGASEVVDALAALLDARSDAQVVEVGLTGIGVRSLAEQLGSRLAAGEVYVVGEGYGSVKALEFMEALDRDASAVAFVEPVFSTRYELLGDERLNGALKAFQLAWTWVLDNFTPHFGLLDELPYNYRTAAAVFDADLELAETRYERLDTRLVLAGELGSGFERYGLAAYRGVQPSCEILLWRGSGEASAAPLANALLFGSGALADSEPGDAATKGLESFPSARLGDVWAGFLLATATLASEDFACIGGGLLAASGSVSLKAAILGCLFGIFLGDFAIYLVGRIFGNAALELPVLNRLVSGKAVQQGADWFQRRGVTLVVLTRFFPGSRVPTYFAAGVVGVGWIRFSLALLLAAAIWTPLLVLASYFLGEMFLEFFESLGVGGWLGILAAIVSFAIFVRLGVKLFTWKGRRLLYSRWLRLRSWEYWPIWAVYLPVLFKIAWLAIRYRSVSLPFSVNPCMPASGLVYESKIQILQHLEKHGVPIARFEAIERDLKMERKLEKVRRFMDRLQSGFPIVLKPDVGQRGQGVAIIRSLEEVEAFFADQDEDAIAQEYVAGREYGVFYHRFASEDRGRVSSVTDKRMTYVEGDGESTLERLILSDRRGVGMGRFFLGEFEAELTRVLPRGERFALASIGTHSRGALFLDGAHLITPELERAVDAFSKGVPGFHFGRYDLRAPSEEHFRRGEGLRVIELNGITSEPTNMYDPQHGPLFGWRSLMRQWELIFALAKENRLAGHEPVSKKFALKLAIGYWRGVPSRYLS